MTGTYRKVKPSPRHMLDRLKARFKEPLQVEVRQAHEQFLEEKGEEIETAEEELQELREGVEEALEELDRELERFEGYQDVEGRNVVEDVADNIVSDRRRMVENFSIPEDPRELGEELDRFVDRFREMKRKESEVLKVVGDDKKPVFDALDTVKDWRDRVSGFLEGKHPVLETHQALQENVEELRELDHRKEQVEEELEEVDPGSVREDIKEVEERLDQLHAGEEWEEYQDLKQELAEARDKEEQVRREVKKGVNRMERGLKKLLYEKSSIDRREILEDIRDGEIEEILRRHPGEVEDAVEEAVETMPGDLLGERQENKFRDAADRLSDLSRMTERLESTREKVQELEEQVREHPAPVKEDQLAAELDELQGELENRRKERRALREELEEVESRIEELEEDVKEELDRVFHREVSFS